MLPHEREEHLGVRATQPDAAVRGAAAEPVFFSGPVHRDVAVEKNRVRHRRPIVAARTMVLAERLDPERAVAGPAVAPAGRDRPLIQEHAVLHDLHPLFRLVDDDVDIGRLGRAAHHHRQSECSQKCKDLHCLPLVAIAFTI